MCFRTARQRREGVGLIFLGLVIVTWVAQSELAQFIQVCCCFMLRVNFNFHCTGPLLLIASFVHFAGDVAGGKLQQTLLPHMVQPCVCYFDAAGGSAWVLHLCEGRRCLACLPLTVLLTI